LSEHTGNPGAPVAPGAETRGVGNGGGWGFIEGSKAMAMSCGVSETDDVWRFASSCRTFAKVLVEGRLCLRTALSPHERQRCLCLRQPGI